MTNTGLLTPRQLSPDPIAEGDALARDGQWQAAVAHWVDGYAGLSPVEKSAREQRVRWVISASGTSAGQQDRDRYQRRVAYRILLLGIVFGGIATALVIAGSSTATGTSPILAIGGWIGITASIICAIVYAFRLSSASNRPLNLPLSDVEIAMARAIAETLDRQSADHHANGDKVG
ncbi:MAG: hypothetical protein AVDCRST_MAG43-1904 [uncultured Thermomicrobiales bacterium]|uniref:Uncharacterized protein n=1 Tax=uncultured Thermomicrobiales bacterium TaxID=1645740 RepID=A0A6J4UVC6_9BACT|nr:MAG: hypothetical protein AVDCRST_MAG43-1904 [uncultured Thermomicrobiales bacterium]